MKIKEKEQWRQTSLGKEWAVQAAGGLTFPAGQGRAGQQSLVRALAHSCAVGQLNPRQVALGETRGSTHLAERPHPQVPPSADNLELTAAKRGLLLLFIDLSVSFIQQL